MRRTAAGADLSSRNLRASSLSSFRSSLKSKFMASPLQARLLVATTPGMPRQDASPPLEARGVHDTMTDCASRARPDTSALWFYFARAYKLIIAPHLTTSNNFVAALK